MDLRWIPGVFAPLVLVVAGALSTPLRAQSDADEQYQFIAGLCEQKQFDLAAREARAFLDQHPRHAKADLARYRLACALYELGKRDEARTEYAALARLQRFEFAGEVAFRLGQCELAANRPDAAAAAFERVRALRVEYLAQPATFFLGEALFHNGDFAGAERAYAEVAADGEYGRGAAYGLAWCAYRLGHHDEAVERIRAFLQARPRDAAAGEMRFLLGESHLAAGRAKEALDAYRTVRDGEFAEPALRGAGFASAALGDHASAAARFGELLQRFPEGTHAAEAALQRGVELLRAGQAAEAVEALSSPRREATAEVHYWRGQAQLAAGDAESALASIEAALAGRPPAELAERLHIARGDALTALGKSEDAARAYSRSDSEPALYGAAIAAHNAGRADDAAKLARSLLEKYPRSAHAQQMQLVVGEASFASKRYDAAESAFRAVVDAGGDEQVVRRATSRLAWCRYVQDDFAGAAESFARVAEPGSQSPEADEAQYMLGVCAEKGGDAPAASSAWRRYVEQFPRGTRRSDALLGLSRVDADAPRWLDAMVRENPDSAAAANALLALADQLAKDGKRDEAIARYRGLLERFPSHPSASAAHYGLAWCLYEAERFDDSAREVEAALADPQLDAKLRVAALELAVWTRAKAKDVDGTLGACRQLVQSSAADRRKLAAARIASQTLVAASRADEAQALYDDLLRRTRDRGAVREILIENAWLALDRKQPDDAEAAVRTALKYGLDDATKPRAAEASFFVGEARFDAGDDARAIELYRIAADQGSPDVAARSLYKLGFAYLRRNDFEAAAASFARLVESHREHELYGEGLYLLGETRCRAKQWEQAIEPLERLRAELPRHASSDKALFRLGVASGELGRWDACESALAELARRNASFEQAAEAELWRGRAQVQRGDARAARATFERLVARDKTVIAARARIELGKLAADAGDHEQALADFLKVALLYANDDEVAEASFLAGQSLEALGQNDRALERYRDVVAKQPRSPFARRAEQRVRELAVR